MADDPRHPSAAQCGGGMNAITEAWAAAKDAYDRATAAEAAYVDSTWNPALEREKRSAELHGGRPATEDLIPDSVDAEIERLADARCEAETTLIQCPAPSLADVIWKVEHARQRWADSAAWPDDWWAAVLGDLRSFGMVVRFQEAARG
jgi:sirohydrochlorin ferrochelatase